MQAAAAARQPPAAVPAMHRHRRLLLLRHNLLPDGLVRQAGLGRQLARRRRTAALLLLHGCQDGIHWRSRRRLPPTVLLLLLAVLGQAQHGAHHQLVLGRLSAQHGQVEEVVGQCFVVQACRWDGEVEGQGDEGWEGCRSLAGRLGGRQAQRARADQRGRQSRRGAIEAGTAAGLPSRTARKRNARNEQPRPAPYLRRWRQRRGAAPGS